MHSIPLGPSEKIPFVQKHKEGAICAILRKKIPFLGHSQRLKKVLLTAQGCARLRTDQIIMQIPRGYQKKSLLCRKARYVRSLGKKTPFLAFPEAKKANWHSQLHAQRSKMHSIPLGPSEKNSFCAKAQRRRDMCDP